MNSSASVHIWFWYVTCSHTLNERHLRLDGIELNSDLLVDLEYGHSIPLIRFGERHQILTIIDERHLEYCRIG